MSDTRNLDKPRPGSREHGIDRSASYPCRKRRDIAADDAALPVVGLPHDRDSSGANNCELRDFCAVIAGLGTARTGSVFLREALEWCARFILTRACNVVLMRVTLGEAASSRVGRRET